MVFDYIVVGGGSAGCAVASRLAEDPSVTVLLLEAGVRGEQVEQIQVPAAWPSLLFSEFDWAFFSEPEEALADRPIYLPRGKVLGGSSAINALVYVRGNSADFDEWRDRGNPDWGYETTLDVFKRSEDNSRGASRFHGVGGPLAVSDQEAPHRATSAFVDAGVAVGIPGNEDVNGETQEGVGLTQVTTRAGRRASAADAFLSGHADGANLTVRTSATVTRVLVENGRAVGVEVRGDGGLETYRCAREVVLSAGAVGSPHLLMLSGIGPADDLRQHGIEPVISLPGVGQHLWDHPCVSVGYSSNDDTPPHHTSNLVEGVLFTRTDNAVDPRPDLEMPFGPILYVAEEYRQEGPGFTFVPLLARPESDGHITLNSADPEDSPRIVLNFLSTEREVATLVDGIQLAREMAADSAFDDFRGSEIAPGPDVNSDNELRDYVRHAGDSLYHMAGTCRMGPGEDAVVDPKLRVHGVEGLRVADASVMPTITTGNTNAAAIMIGERAAEFLAASN